MATEATYTIDAKHVNFAVTCGAVKIGKDLYTLDEGEPLYVANKANLRIVKTGIARYGGEQWERMKAFQAAVRLHGRAALRTPDGPEGWPRDRIGYWAFIVLDFGDRLVDVKPQNGKPHQRRMKAKTRWRAVGTDKSIEAILDGLEGVLWRDDERVTLHRVEKIFTPGRLGDHVYVSVFLPLNPRLSPEDLARREEASLRAERRYLVRSGEPCLVCGQTVKGTSPL